MTTHRILGASMLAALRPGHDWRPALDEAMGLGFTLARVFCGPLPWCGQELQHVYDHLPAFLEDLRDRSMHGYLSYITEAGTGYDLKAHVDEVERIAHRDNTLREVANEPYHPTQGGLLTPERCQSLSARMLWPAGFGAAEDDESPEYAGGSFVPWHRDRGRELWNDVRRQREGLALQDSTGKPVLDQEGKGAAEASVPGKREADPAYFYTQAALAQLFNLGGTVFHSDDGLWARPLSPNQRRCAEAFVAGFKLIPTLDLTYKNAEHDGSPVRSATFNDGDMSKAGCTRAYSGIAGGSGYTVELGCVGPSTIAWNWSRCDIIGQMPGVRVYAVAE